MVVKIYRYLTQRSSSIQAAALVLGLFTVLSQILALVRDRLFAHIFGASATLDIYYAAFKIPDLVYVLAASTVSLSVLIPVLSKKIEMSEEEAKVFLSRIFSFFITFITVLSVSIWLTIPFFAHLVFPGFTIAETETLITLSRILLLSPVFLGISSLLSSIVQIKERFLLYSLSPVLYNLGIIGGILLLYPFVGIKGLAFGVIIGAFFHMLIQLPFFLRSGFNLKITRPRFNKELRDLFLTSLPRALTLSTAQILFVVFIGIASRLGEGSIAVFTFSFNLQSVPVAIVGASFSVAAFPTLSKMFARRNLIAFTHSVARAIDHVLFWSVPLVGVSLVLKEEIVRVLLGTGAFSWGATVLTSICFSIFVFSLFFQSVSLLFTRSFYASGNTWKPFIATSIGVFVSVSLALVALNEITFFVLPEIPGFSSSTVRSIILLASAYTIGQVVTAGLLFFMFVRKYPLRLREAFAHAFSTVISWGIAMGIGFAVKPVFGSILPTTTVVGIVLTTTLTVGAILVVGCGILYILKNDLLLDLAAKIHNRHDTTNSAHT